MKTNTFYRPFLIAFLCVFFVLDISAQNGDFDEFVKNRMKPLIGLNSIEVKVQPLNSEIKIEGLSEEQIQKDVESQLRNSGITVKSPRAYSK